MPKKQDNYYEGGNDGGCCYKCCAKCATPGCTKGCLWFGIVFGVIMGVIVTCFMFQWSELVPPTPVITTIQNAWTDNKPISSVQFNLTFNNDTKTITMNPYGDHQTTLIFLHGFSQKNIELAPGFASLYLAPSNMKIIMPQAPMVDVTTLGNKSYSWFDVLAPYDKWYSHKDELDLAFDQTEVINMADKLDDWVQNATNEFPDKDRKRVLIGGFSQGGMVSLAALTREQAPLGGVLALSTLEPLTEANRNGNFTAAGQTPLLWYQGLDDPIVTPNVTAYQQDWFSANIYKGKYSENLYYETEAGLGNKQSFAEKKGKEDIQAFLWGNGAKFNATTSTK